MSLEDEFLTEAETQCVNEIKGLYHRWSKESDLEDEEIIRCAEFAAREYYEDQSVIFLTPDVLVEEEDDDDELGMGDDQEGS